MTFKLFAALLVTVTLILPGKAARARDVSTIVIGYGEWPPFESGSLPQLGPVPALVAAAFASGGTHVDFKSLPWWRMLHELETGNLDGALIWRDVGGRRAKFLLSDPIFNSQISLFYRENEVRPWTKLSDLSTLKIGATTSYRYCPEFDRLEAQGRLKVERAAADELNFSKLLARRIDAMIVDSEYGHWRLAHQGESGGKIVEDKHEVCTVPMYMLISREIKYGPELTERFNAGLRQLKNDGRFDRLLGDLQH